MKILPRLLLSSLLAASYICFAEDIPPYPTAQCSSTLPELKILEGKIPIGQQFGDTPLEILANNHKPTKAEKKAIALLAVVEQDCFRAGDEWRAKYLPPPVTAILEQSFVTTKSLLADLYAGKLTYGDYAKQRDAALAKSNADLTDTIHKLMAENQAQQERAAEEANRRYEDQQARDRAYEQQQEIARAQQRQADRNAVLMMFLSRQPTYIPPIQPGPRYVPQPQPNQAPPSTTRTDCELDAIGHMVCNSR